MLSNAVNYPSGTLTISVCNGITATEVASDSWAGDYFDVNVISGETYKFNSSVPTDFFTISTDANATATASGVTPLTWVSTVTGVIRVNLNTDIACGTDANDRVTSVICGTPCLNGTGPYPFDTYTPTTCDGTTVNLVADDSWAGEYSNVEMFSSNTYTISSSVGTDQVTITSEDGTTALAVGTGSLIFTPTINGVFRVYFHTDSACGTENVGREKTIVCTSSVTAPGCPQNPSPVDGSTSVNAFGDIILSWDAPTTGDPVVSYNVYGGVDPMNLFFFGNVTTTSFNAGPVDTYDFSAYWQVLAVNAAGESVGCAVWAFTTESQPTDTPDYVALQWPPSITITQGDSGTVYGQVYEAGLTDVVPNIDGQAPGILAWVGISPEGSNTNPDTWTNWVPATWNSFHISNNDEYQANIGGSLAPGTYYYATRFTLNNGPYVYGGINSTNDGSFWDGTTYLSGVLTVNPAPAPANDECSGAIALTLDDTFCIDNTTNTNGTNLGATDSGLGLASCFNYGENDVWYTFTAGVNTATVNISTDFINGNLNDSEVALYSGACGSLTELDCDNDGGIVVQENGFSWNSLILDTPVTAGQTYYVRVSGYGNGPDEVGSFCLRVSTNQTLANDSFSDSKFSLYPNPVKDVLNLSYSEIISKVQILNLLGQEVESKSINANQGQINMSELSAGTYLVKVTSNENAKTIKVIKK